MRGVKAKKIRRETYGDFSSRSETTEYKVVRDHEPIIAIGKRREYQDKKRQYKFGKNVILYAR